jgi:ferritin-like metal-binding protein YciE
MSSVNELKELLVDELKDLYSAETQLTKALPKMAKAASNPTLKQGFTDHLEQTKGHVERIIRAMEILEESPKGKTCKAMKGLVEEGSEAIEQEGPASLRDANLIGAAQRVEHYEIAAYGTTRAFAQALGEDEIVSLLTETLGEEVDTDKKLTTVSKKVNQDALRAGDEDEDS